MSRALKVFHENVGHNWREGRPHCCSFYLLIEALAKLEIGGLQARLHQAAEVGNIDVGSALREASFCRHWEMTTRTSFTGTLVNKLATSTLLDVDVAFAFTLPSLYILGKP